MLFDVYTDDPVCGYRCLVEEAGEPTAEHTAWRRLHDQDRAVAIAHEGYAHSRI